MQDAAALATHRPSFRPDTVYYDGMMTKTYLRVFAWLVLAFIFFVTVSPIELRPHTIFTVNIDRAGAYLLAGLVFALAYPKQWKLIALFLVVGAIAFEFMQEFSPTRHARLHDALVKAGGALAGVTLGRILTGGRVRHMVSLIAGNPTPAQDTP
jgi:VanZ family protein